MITEKKIKKEECIICKNNNFTYLFSDLDRYVKSTKKKFSIYKCTNCDLISIDPKINESEFSLYYPESYTPYNLSYKKRTSFDFLLKKIRKYLLDILKIDKIKIELDCFKDVEKKYLDFGCGSGRHLNHIKYQYPKWKLYGHDRSHYAKNNLNKININFVEDLQKMPDNFFDFINLSSVIEHLIDPSETMHLLRKKLKKNGIIIIKTPNWNSLGRVIFRQNWIQYDIPRHIHVFSSKNLKEFLIKKNFKILKTMYSNNFSVELKSIYRSMKLSGRPKIHGILEKFFLPFGILLNIAALSSTITIIGKKNV